MLDSAEACLKLTPPPCPGMYDLEFGVKFSPIHHSLASSDITPVSAAEQFATLLKGVVYPWYTHVLELGIGLGHI